MRIIKIDRRFSVRGGGRMTSPEKAKPQITLDLEKRKKMERRRRAK